MFQRLYQCRVLGGLLLTMLFSGGAWSAKPASQAPDLLCRCAKPYQAVGVNYFDGVYRRIRHPEDTSYIKGLDLLKKYNVPFARISMSGHWPAEFKLYTENPKLYFKIIDEFLAAAEARNIGIVASVFWNYAAIPDLMGEPMTAWGRADSKTSKLAKKMTDELVERYKGRSVIWAWEFGNELMLRADLPNAERLRPQLNPGKGTPVSRSEKDDLSSNEILDAYGRFASSVRSKEPLSLLSSGNSLPRPFAYNNTKSRSWKLDTKNEFCSVLNRDNPKGFDFLSIHIYADTKGYFSSLQAGGYSDVLKEAAACSAQSKRPLFIGEFGVGSKDYASPVAEQAAFQAMLRDVVDSGAALSAVWVFDFPFHRGNYNIYQGEREYQLQSIADMNRTLISAEASRCSERIKLCTAPAGAKP